MHKCFCLHNMYVHRVHAWCLGKSKEDGRSSGTIAMDDCEPAWDFCELNPSLLQAQQVLLTIELFF